MISQDPRGLTWDAYCNLMVENFANNQLVSVPEERWKEWVSSLNGIGYFSEQGIPDSTGYKDWKDWAKAMCGIVNVNVNQV